MTAYTDRVEDDYGRAVPNAQVTVYASRADADNDILAAGVTPNPATTDEFGIFTIDAPDGLYFIVTSYTGRPLEKEYILVGTGPSVPAAVIAALTPFLDQIMASQAAAAASAAAAATSARSTTLTQKIPQRILTREDATLSYLPTLTTASAAYYGVWSTDRLISGYVGPLLRAINPVGGATVDLGTGARRVKPFDAKNLRGSAVNVHLDKWYDQSGNGRDFTQTTDAQRPAIHEDGTINGRLAVTFGWDANNTARVANFASPAISLARDDFTMFLVMDPTASMKDQDYFRFQRANGDISANLLNGFGIDNGRAAVNYGGAIRQSHVYLQASPLVFVMTTSGGNLTLWLDDNVVACGAAAAETMTLLYLGSDPIATVYSGWRCGACVIVNKALNDADIAVVSAVLRERFRLSTDYDATIVYSGTSRTVAGQAVNAFSKLFYEQKYFGRNYRVINLGQDGQALSTTLSNFASREAAAYDATKPWILVIDDAINDLGGLGASSNPTTIYNSTITGLVNAAKALGSNVRVVVRTTLPQDSTGVYGIASATIEANRQTLNALILANSAGADLVIDTASIAGVGTYPTDPDDLTKYYDKLHATALLNSMLGPTNGAGIESLTLP